MHPTTTLPATDERLCRIQRALGRVEGCTRETCPFWEPGGAALEGRCAVDRLDLADPRLADWLLGLRRELEAAHTREDEREVWRMLTPLLDPDAES